MDSVSIGNGPSSAVGQAVLDNTVMMEVVIIRFFYYISFLCDGINVCYLSFILLHHLFFPKDMKIYGNNMLAEIALVVVVLVVEPIVVVMVGVQLVVIVGFESYSRLAMK